MLAVACSRWPMVLLLAAVYLTGAVVAADSSSAASSTATSSAPTSLSLTTSYTPLVTTIQSGGNNITISTAVPVSTFNVTVTSTASASALSNSTAAAASQSAAAEAVRTLDTQIDPAFGVLGALLILTGLPSAFLGHKNRWTSFFLIGVYTLALVCSAPGGWSRQHRW